MTTYNTLNPMPSSAPKDLYDNAQVIDDYVNSELPSTTDRFGRRRETMAGMEQAFDDFLLSSGFQDIGDYDLNGPLTITRRNQVFTHAGVYWRAGPDLVLPYTTVNNWATDAPKFVMTGDTTLKADLASTSGSLGATLVNGSVRTVASIAALKALPKTGSPVVYVQSYYPNVKGGGGYFRVDLSDVVGPANGGTIIQANDGALWKRINNRPLTLVDFGADASGTTDAVPQMIAYATASSELIFPEGQFRINSPITFGPGKNVTFETNASVFVTGTGSVSFQGAFHSVGFGRLFYGTGPVTGIRNVWPEWWGAVGNGVNDDVSAFQAAHSCLINTSTSQGGPLTLNAMAKTYAFGQPFSFQPGATNNLRFIGAGSGEIGGTRLRPLLTFTSGPVFYLLGQNIATEQAGDFVVKDFRVAHNPAGNGGATSGMTVGTPLGTYRTEGFHCNVIENVVVTNFTNCWDIVHARLIDFNRCSGWATTVAGVSNALLIRQAGNFTGDLRFNNCQFVSNEGVAGNASVKINSDVGLSTGAPFNMIAGIKFNECDFYQSDKKVMLLAGSGSRIADIWFTNCQWDGNSNQDIYIASSGVGSVVDDINFVQCYVAGGNLNPALDQLLAFSNAGGSIGGISITGGNWQLAQGKTMNFQGCVGVTVDGVIIRDNNNQSGAAVEFGACTRFSFTDNRQDRVTGNFSKYTVQIGSTCNVFNVTNNIGAGIVSTGVVNDLTGAVSKVVANNL